MRSVGGAGAAYDGVDGPYQGANGPEAQELTARDQVHWRKSSWSAFNGNCVEIAQIPGQRIGVRDSKNHGRGPVLLFDGGTWCAFVASVKNGSLPL